MLNSSFARKVLRLRTLRLVSRALHDVRADQVCDSSQFPLYRPLASPFPSHNYTSPSPRLGSSRQTDRIDLSDLPSDSDVHRLSKSRLTSKATASLPDFTESQLQSFYRDVVRSGIEGTVKEQLKSLPPPRRTRTGVEERWVTLKKLSERLGLVLCDSLQEVGMEISSKPESSRSVERLKLGEENGTSTQKIDYRRLVVALSMIAPELPESGIGSLVPTGVIKRSEWIALFDEFIDQRTDPRAVEVLFEIMMRHGVRPDLEMVEDLIQMYSKRGETVEVTRLITELQESGLPISDYARDQIILSYLSGPLPPRVDEAITTLTTFEKLGQPFPQSSYNYLLTHLTQSTLRSHPTSHTRALAWDLFAHMRLAAHPTPSRVLYTTMIRACADSNSPEPERARDLWIEMTESEGIQPTRQEYDAIIRALGTTKKDYLEAFDLLRQMLAKYEDIALAATPMEQEEVEEKISVGRVDNDQDLGGGIDFKEIESASRAWIPTKETFAALLEGTKRAGDLDRARWVLQELARLLISTPSIEGKLQLAPNEEIMANMFMTYAAWRPKLRRMDVKEGGGGAVIEKGVKDGEEEKGKEGLEAMISENKDVMKHVAEDGGNDGEMGPQTSAEALREAESLFNQILADNARLLSLSKSDVSNESERENDKLALFANVKITTRLINSYLSIHLSHAPTLAAAREAYNTIWSTVSNLLSSGGSMSKALIKSENKTSVNGITPNGWTYLFILERCARGSRGGIINEEDKAIARSWGEEIWKQYLDFSTRIEPTLGPLYIDGKSSNGNGTSGVDPSFARRRRWLVGLGPRQIERCWISMIRLYAIHSTSSQSLSLYDQFLTLYPPSLILSTYTPTPPRLTIGLGSSVRLSDPTKTAEPDVPPHILFRDIDVLHNRLVRDEDKKGIGKLKWGCLTYQKMLEKRRKWRIKGVGVARLIRAFEKRKSKETVGVEKGLEKVGQGKETFDSEED